MKNELNVYLEAIKTDYLKWSALPDNVDAIKKQIRDESYVRFAAGLRIEEGSKYLKVLCTDNQSRRVHSFIVKEDGLKFKKGDILKAATFNAPAKNQARGNLFTGYRVQWTGAEYLK